MFLVPLVALGLGGAAAPARATGNLKAIRLYYHGGPLLQKPRAVTLFWGSFWKTSSLPSYFNSFFRTLFVDGRYMANLSQYSTQDYTVGNGSFGGTLTDAQDPQAQTTDDQIQAEIKAQLAAGKLRQPTPDTIYFVFLPPQVGATNPMGLTSQENFSGYHYWSQDGDYAYAVIPWNSQFSDANEPQLETVTASHELAEAVTDPQPFDSTTVAWYDNNNGEVADIPEAMFEAGTITQDLFVQELDGSDGTPYFVQAVWSAKDKAPVAFGDPNATGN